MPANLHLKLFFAAYLSLVAQCSYTQQIQSVISLDAIINTKHITANDENLIGAIKGNQFWIYVPSWAENDSVLFLKLDLTDYHLDSVWSIVPQMSSKLGTPNAYSMTINDKYLVLSFSQALGIFEIQNNGLVNFKKVVSFPLEARYIRLQKEYLFFGRCYNYHPKSQSVKAMIGLYDMVKDTIIKAVAPRFDNIEFSHFAPDHWIDATENKMLFAQTTAYHIDIFDSRLSKVSEIKRNIADWKQFDTSAIIQLRKEIPPGNSKIMIEALSPYEDAVSRVEAAYFLDDATIIVRYIPAGNKEKKRLRMYDIWRLKNKEWKLIHADLKDEKPLDETVIDKNNFPVLSVFSDSYWTKDKLLMIKYDAEIQRIGRQHKTAKKEADDYYINNDPRDFIYIYSIKK